MKIKSIISFLLCSVLLLSLISCADPQSPEDTSKVPSESAGTPANTESPETTEESKAGETDAETTADTTAEETTSEPPVDLSAKQIPEGYYANAETEFPLIITLGGEKVEATLRAVTLRTKLGTRAYYIDVLYDGKVIATQFFRGAVQICATSNTSDHFALLRISDNHDWSPSAGVSFYTYYLSDIDISHGTPEKLEKPEFQWTGGINASLHTRFEDSSVNRNLLNTFIRKLDKDIPTFESQYSKLCVVLDSLSDLEKDLAAYPADGLPMYDYTKIMSNPYYREISQNYADYDLITGNPNYFTKEYLPLELPEGWSMPNYAIGGNVYYVTIDGVNYECLARMISIDKGEEHALYVDLVDIINRKVLTSTMLEGFFRLYEHNDNFTSRARFILERYNKTADGKVEISTSEYAFTEYVSDASGSTKAEIAFRPVYNENNYSATVTLDPADAASAEKIAELGKRTAAIAGYTEFGAPSFWSRAYSDNASVSWNPIGVAGSWYKYDESFYTAKGLNERIFEIKPQY